MQTHETVTSFRKVEIGSNRKFGLTLGLLFLVVAFLPLIRHDSPKWWALALGVVLVGFGLLVPQWLTPFNRAWFKLGLALNTVVSPIFMAVLFFSAVVPVGFILRRQGQDLLALKMAPDAKSYWTLREPPGPAQGSMTKQF